MIINYYLWTRRLIVASVVLLALLILLAVGSGLRVSSLEKKIRAQELIVAASEAEAATHRARSAELEKAMAARDVLIQAKDVLIDANSNKRAALNEQVADEQRQFDNELALGADLTPDQLRDRICARFAAAHISAEAYCGR